MAAASYDVFETELGWILAAAEAGALVRLAQVESVDEARRILADHHAEAHLDPKASPLPSLRSQLSEYLEGDRQSFDLPLAPRGSEFQQLVWSALQEIPYGETRSYADIARAVHRPKGYQAVGQANHRNPIGIVIPCHRVIAADGGLGGYAVGSERKQLLLDLERAPLQARLF